MDSASVVLPVPAGAPARGRGLPAGLAEISGIRAATGCVAAPAAGNSWVAPRGGVFLYQTVHGPGCVEVAACSTAGRRGRAARSAERSRPAGHVLGGSSCARRALFNTSDGSTPNRSLYCWANRPRW
ncbi:hypothetical protein ACFPM0_11685 [Pseudonocardia sulfidoxydans]|uniref:hypothetical protein n=1 Tax=Pseudonocardia sulfidoxydans TaxID=54011 RepID=UPI00361BDC96